MNYTQYLINHNYYEEAFRVFEKSLTLFSWPGLYNIWLIYLKEFIKRYQDQRIERTRDMFEKALHQAPLDKKRIFFLMYADFEETHGLINHAIEIYDRMVEELDYSEKL